MAEIDLESEIARGKPIRVSISAAAGETQDSEDLDVWRVGRPDLVGILQLAMQSRRLPLRS